MSNDTLAPTIRLTHGADMPSFGFDTVGRGLGNEGAAETIRMAIDSGYRLFATVEVDAISALNRKTEKVTNPDVFGH